MPRRQLASAQQINELTEKLDTFIVHVTDSMARTETTALNTNQRLFGHEGQPGIIQHFQAAHKELETAVSLKADVTDVKELSDKHDKLATKVTWYSGIAAGVQAVLGALFGWHIGHGG